MKNLFAQGLALAVLVGLTNCAYAASYHTYDLEEMVVSASKSKLNVKELPQSAEIITKEDIKSIGATNVYEALTTSVSVDGMEGLADRRLRLRGSSDVVVLVNGHRMATDKGSGNMFIDKLNVQNIERIEILRGPAAALYGSDAMAGVINIITKGVQEEGATVGVTTGKREMSNYYRFDTGEMGKVAATLNANFTKVRDFAWPGQLMTPFVGPKQNFTLDVEYEMDDNNKLSFSGDYENDDMHYTSGGKYQYYEAERKGARLTYDGKSAKSDYSVSAIYSEIARGNSKTGAFDTPKNKYFNIDARNSVKSTDNFTLTYGAELKNEKGYEKMGKQGFKNIYERTDLDQWSGYIYGEYKAGEKLLIAPSLRYDDHETFGGEASPSLGITYFVDDSSRIKASYGKGYKTPTYSEMYGTSDPWSMTMGGEVYNFPGTLANPNLKPEISKGFEIAFEKDFSNTTFAKLSYYKNDKKDAIVRVDGIMVEVDGKLQEFGQQQNIDEASFEGAEFELTHHLGNGLVLGFNYAYLDAQNSKEHARLKNNARNTIVAKLMWTEPEKQEWSATLWNKWLSDYKCNKDEKNRSISTLNLTVNKSWEDNKYNAFVALDNILDKKDTEMRYSGRVWRCGAEVRF